MPVPIKPVVRTRIYRVTDDLEIRVRLDSRDGYVGSVATKSNQYLRCSHCGDPMCEYDCEGSQAADDAEINDSVDSMADVDRRLVTNHAIIGIEVFLMSLAGRGVNIADKVYSKALAATVAEIYRKGVEVNPSAIRSRPESTETKPKVKYVKKRKK